MKWNKIILKVSFTEINPWTDFDLSVFYQYRHKEATYVITFLFVNLLIQILMW